MIRVWGDLPKRPPALFDRTPPGVGMAKKMGVPLLSAPDQGVWHRTKGAGHQHFSFPPAPELKQRNSWWVWLRVWGHPSLMQCLLTEWRHMVDWTYGGPDYPDPKSLIEQRFHTGRSKSRPEAAADKSISSEILPRGKAVHRGLQSFPQRNWPHLKQSAGMFKPQGALENSSSS